MLSPSFLWQSTSAVTQCWQYYLISLVCQILAFPSLWDTLTSSSMEGWIRPGVPAPSLPLVSRPLTNTSKLGLWQWGSLWVCFSLYLHPLKHIHVTGMCLPQCFCVLPVLVIFPVYGYVICDHMRALYVYMSALNGSCPLVGIPCSSYDDFLKGLCTNCDVFKGPCPRIGESRPLPATTGDNRVH